MNSRITRVLLAGATIAAVLVAGILIGRRAPVQEEAAAPAAQQQSAAPKPTAPPSEAVMRDPYQRSLAIYEFKKAAQSGPDRGREIFYYKCWFCHNEFAKGAPALKGVFQRDKLLSGRPTTEDGIKDEIRNGGAGMAAYKYTLNDADLSDLAAYLKDQCCWDSNSPPPNPRYRAGAEE
jgi:mono/diheme cytochrome c family protein